MIASRTADPESRFYLATTEISVVTMPGRSMQTTPSGRDLRLDLVRGFTMLIIFVAHVPGNTWADYIPARFGFSSGAEVFVLCSGIASGLAFGGIFERKGFAEGTRRIFKRIVQLYVAHLVLLAILGSLALGIDALNANSMYTNRYELGFLREQPLQALLAYTTLRYVPAFFDILPMYIVLLAMVPIVMWVRAKVAFWKPLLALSSLALWLAMQIWHIHLPNGPDAMDTWYFNPLAWQLLFFLGFAFGRGWIKAPAANQPWLLWLSGLYVAAAIPINFWGINEALPALAHFQQSIYPPDAITILHTTRFLHIAALGYLVLSALAPVRHKLEAAWFQPFIRVGQQSFPSFLVGVALSMSGGIILDMLGHGMLVTSIVNMTGIIALLLMGWVLAKKRPDQAGDKGKKSAQKNDGQMILRTSQG
jgi:hypothetical protein